MPGGIHNPRDAAALVKDADADEERGRGMVVADSACRDVVEEVIVAFTHGGCSGRRCCCIHHGGMPPKLDRMHVKMGEEMEGEVGASE